MRGLTLEEVWGGRPHLRAPNQTSSPQELARAASHLGSQFAAATLVKQTLFLIRPHVYEKPAQPQTLELLVLGKLRTFASSYRNMRFQPVGGTPVHTERGFQQD